MLCCLYEDRTTQIPGLKLLLLTLRTYCPAWPIRLHFPHAPDSFKAWLKAHHQIEICESALPGANSYNVKPEVLLDGLSTGAEICIWLDTDILVNGSLAFIEGWAPEELVVATDPWEYANGSAHRTSTWGLAIGRNFPGPVNSCVVRVSERHTDLLRNWSTLVRRPDYLAEQSKPVGTRNPHMLGDQDALSALLASQTFSSIPVRRLVHGSQILQHHGAGAFGPKERMMVLHTGLPPLLHAMGTIKPWRMPSKVSFLRDPRSYYERLYLELSPYTSTARTYRKDLSEPDTSWLEIRTIVGKIESMLTADRSPMRGLLQATLHRTIWESKRYLASKALHRSVPQSIAGGRIDDSTARPPSTPIRPKSSSGVVSIYGQNTHIRDHTANQDPPTATTGTTPSNLPTQT